jgi:hypothetical protein
LQGVHDKSQTQPLNKGKNNKNQSNRLDVFIGLESYDSLLPSRQEAALEVVGLAMGREVEVEVEEALEGDVTETGIAPAAMRLCLLRRVNASSATRLSLPLVGMEVPEPVMEVSVARPCLCSL